MAIPRANIKAGSGTDCVATAVPIVKPTDSPSGILCIVIAEKSLNARFLPVFSPILKHFLLMQSKISIKAPPKTNPIPTGKKLKFFHDVSAFSSAGLSNDQNEADSIMPEASPIVSIFMILDSFLKKNTNADPNVVIKQGSVKPKMIVRV